MTNHDVVIAPEVFDPPTYSQWVRDENSRMWCSCAHKLVMNWNHKLIN